MRLDFCEIPDPRNNPPLYNAQLPPPPPPSPYKIKITLLYGFPVYWDVFSDWTFKTKLARRNHTNPILLFTCNIAREQALLLMLDSNQSKKEPRESLHAGDLQYYSQTISTQTSLSTDVFSCSKKTEGTHLYAHLKLAVNKSPAVLCFHKSKQRFCEQVIPKLVISLEIFRFQYRRWNHKYLNNTIKRSA